ncbi:S-layer protein [Priestia megaterium]|uniref:S-layer protein n=1 Tax=Priestia megaterium TaxID=1404 RepID=UPI000BF487EA|nr:S-layer protein [Priestia megaterium]MDH2449452.1 S-layer protein [Priestia megaterium]MDL5148910.1 S-layer protein [Priestia megaterium]PER71843.1 S-layer protein [Priestia megaterium]PEU53143.1 S-layer protein [Priestia megaterium]PFP34275.1 S-layer protein [Priestia megaterium]
MLKRFKSITILALSVTILGQGVSSVVYAKEKNEEQPIGHWMKGEYHAHTTQSDDAQQSQTVQLLLDKAFDTYSMDWIAISDHLRMSSRDAEGNTVPDGPIPLSQGLAQYQIPKIKELQEAGKYKNKIIFSGFEWDMPTYEHVGIGIIGDQAGSKESLKAANQFEYLFTNRDEKLFNSNDVATWKKNNQRAYTTAEDARIALNWLEKNYKKTSYAILNHPSRKTVYKISDFRDFNNLAPDVAFGFEGIPGNQMEPDRGGLNLTTPENRTYGGADYMLAKVGGTWDALLGEGRKFWSFSNSDSHFEISDNRLYSSGYWPGQYSKNYTWVNGNTAQAIVNGMRSGKSFSVNGDLINELDFKVSRGAQKAEMGEQLKTKKGKMMTITIRFKSPEKNNNGDKVKVDHVDLIAGDVTGKVRPGTAAYNNATNSTTKVIKRFTEKDWKVDRNGYYVMKYKIKATTDQYFRLRGTNLGLNVPGEMKKGEPLIDPRTDIEDNETRFAEINKRNYKDLWFYSNPIFLDLNEKH